MSTETATLTDADVKRILEESKTIAIVGWSDREDRPSHETAKYLRKQGYKVIPVNPRLAGKQWDGQPIYDCVTDIPEKIDLVDVFRRSEFTPYHARKAAKAGAKAFWLQLGIVNEEAGQIAREAGMTFVQDRCTHIDHLRLVRGIGMPSPQTDRQGGNG